MKKILILSLLLIANFTFAQNTSKPTIKIQTTAECNECKARIENKLNYTKGISWAELDVSSKVCTVKFNSKKISKAEILSIIANLGYDADSVKANVEAYKALPACCKIGGGEQH